MSDLKTLLGKAIPADHARQVHSQYYLEEILTAADRPHLIVDLGCGDGKSHQIAQDLAPDVTWVGVDIPRSDTTGELRHLNVVFYDGVRLPFPDDSVPAIYSNQVFEHVRHPEQLLAEIRRVLQPGGVFIGSTSQMEPYHSWSVYSYTVYGWAVICEDAGLILDEIRPGIDAIALVQRQWFGRRKEMSAWYQRSPLNVEIDQSAAARGRPPYVVNAQKLQYAGQFSFRVSKPGPERFARAVALPELNDAPRVAPMVPNGAPPKPRVPKKTPPPPSRVRKVRRLLGRVKRRIRRS